MMTELPVWFVSYFDGKLREKRFGNEPGGLLVDFCPFGFWRIAGIVYDDVPTIFYGSDLYLDEDSADGF